MELIRRIDEPLSYDGRRFRAAVYGDQQWDGAWHAWIAFFGDPDGLIATDLQTVQPNLTALRWWAEGLSSVQLGDGLRRAFFLEANPEDRADEQRF